MTKVIASVGLPGSGKTTKCRELYNNFDGSKVFWSGDDWRIMHGFGNYKYDAAYNPQLLDSLLEAALKSMPYFDLVMIDEAQLTQSYQSRQYLKSRVNDYNFDISFLVLYTPISECIRRRHSDPKGLDPNQWDQIITLHNTLLEYPDKKEEWIYGE